MQESGYFLLIIRASKMEALHLVAYEHCGNYIFRI